MLLNNQEITEEIKEEIKKYIETNEKGNISFQNQWNRAKAIIRGKFIYSDTDHPQETRKLSNSLNFHLQELEGLPWWRSG